jgi:hypothetical protein
LATLQPLVFQLYALYGNNEPILFYPKAETYERNSRKILKSGRGSSTSFSTAVPVAVIGDEYIPTPQTCPGYILNVNDQLIYFKDITEDYAWLNDVWVVGQEEDVSPENMIAAPEDVAGTQGRFEGQAEYTGYIQVTNLGEIEHWTSGKLEFNTTVFNSTGSKVWGTKRYGKWKRENFRDQKWANFGSSFIGNWNTSTYGGWMYEHWMEEDGGQSSEITVTFTTPPNAQTGVPGNTVSTKIPSRQRDDDLAGSLVQFTDDINQIYNINFMNFKRKNQQ